MNLQSRTESYKKYLDALNFRSSDLVCTWFTGDRNYFQSFDAYKTPHTIKRLFERNESGQDVYLSMAAFQPGTTNRVKESVASVRHVWIDADANGPEVLAQIKKDITDGIIPNFAVAVESSPGKLQIIWLVDMDDFRIDGKPDIAKQESLNRALQQRYSTDAAVVDTARVLRVPGFVNHKYDSKPIAHLLEVGDSTLWKMSDFKIAPATAEVKKSVDASVVGDKIPHGSHDTELTRIAGKFRQDGMEVEAMTNALIEICEKRCEGYGDDYRQMCEKIARSICKKPVGKDETVIFGSASVVATPNETPEIDTTAVADRPVFPYWVLEGTTIGEGFVKPVVATSSKHAEFLFMPAVQLVINSLFGTVRMKYQTTKLNMFVGLVAPYGRFFKSTSCELAQQYFKEAGLAAIYSNRMSNADAKVVISGASGSPEGFGKLMRRLNTKHAILYCDELGKFVSKAGIESSAWSSDLLTMYGSGDFNNTVKAEKDSFAFEAGTYCFSWLWCTTDRAFNRLWPKLAGISTGLEDRMFFVLCPEKPNENSEYQDPQFQGGAIETRQAIEAAVQQGVFDYEFLPAVQEALKGLDPRSMELVQTLALYFAIDLKQTEITGECIDRAKALVEYRNAVARYLAPIEALNEQARLQKEIRRELQRNRGQMKRRDLCRELHYEDYGMDVWSRAFSGLVHHGEVIEFVKTSPSGQKIKMVGLVKLDD